MNKYISLIGIISISVFSSEVIPKKGNFGAGILPLVYDETNSRYYFLLGKENADDGYHSHGTFSDFGGNSKPGENSAQTALREFKEEIGFSDDLFDLAFNLNPLNNQYHSVMEFKRNGLTHFTYHMYLLPVRYDQIKSDQFKEALKKRDKEKSTIVLFPAAPFLKTFENFQEKPDTKHEIYQETVDGKTTEYPIRRSFRKSLQIMIQESKQIKNILDLNYSNNMVEIICEDNQTGPAIGNNKQGKYTVGTLFSLVIISSIGIIFLLFLGKNYFFKATPTAC